MVMDEQSKLDIAADKLKVEYQEFIKKNPRLRPWSMALGDLEYSLEDRLTFLKNIYSNPGILSVLKKVIEMKLTTLETEKMSNKLYENPNWALKQADYIGSKRAFTAIKFLLP